MISGITIYDTVQISSKEALELAEFLFEKLCLPITGASYYEFFEDGEHPEGESFDVKEVSVSALKEKISIDNTMEFSIYSEKSEILPWFASFHFNTEEGILGLSHINIQYPFINSSNEIVKNFFQDFCKKFSCSYAIHYNFERWIDAFYYAQGDNFVNLYDFECSSLFNKECPGRYRGRARYRGNKLRMVYDFNVINNLHLNIAVKNISLKEWILEDEKRGRLSKLNNDMWVWEVEGEELVDVNYILGEEGVLISWRLKPIKKSPRKLPG